MTKDEIIRMAREAGIDAESDTLTRYEGFVEPLTRFAKLVVANIDPKSFMSWQEGYEVGVVAEREAIAKLAEGTNGTAGANYLIANAIRARTKT